ncbi:MAG TPA: endonuclease/exonuclease/phosphatase family protein [Bryobacteraceae bacterium]|nr:endonuclease/exonuclease/phosphatase family protein [Bryobacteraceae bacterium]
MQAIRIATYNIHKARGLDSRTRVERIARVLETVGADIVALQEVVSREGPSIEDHQARYLARRLGQYFAIGETRKHRGGVYGNVTLSRWDFERIRQIDLSVCGREERGVLRTDIKIGRHLVHVFNVHLGTAHYERKKQAVRLMDQDLLRAVDISGPRIVLGDFNDWTHGLVTRTLSAEFHFSDIAAHLRRTRGYPGFLPLLHLDHIYCDHHLKIASAHFQRDRLAVIASDHLPLVADLKI